MKKTSEIISCPVISIFESESMGIIHNLLFDIKLRKCIYAQVINDSEGIPTIIKTSDLYKIGKDCVLIKNKSHIHLQNNYEKELSQYISPINLKVYNMNGEDMGYCTDIVLNDKFEMDKIILNNNKEIHNKEIFNIGKSAILIDIKKSNLNKFRPVQKIITIQEKDESKVLILSAEKPMEKQENDTNQNTKILTDYRFLVGRILSKDIIAMNGEIIAKKNAIVSKEIVNKASFYGKLIEIARYSNKNKNA